MYILPESCILVIIFSPNKSSKSLSFSSSIFFSETTVAVMEPAGAEIYHFYKSIPYIFTTYEINAQLDHLQNINSLRFSES